jgi:uncharacterized protein (DUF2062 family)
MKKKNLVNATFRFFKYIYLKLFRIHDTAQRIALGVGLGVCLGIIPGTGPVIALLLAWILRLNRAAALIGSLLTNTWLSIVTFLLSIKVGSAILRVDWHQIQKDWSVFLKDLRWSNFLQLSISKVILPVIVGYLVVAFSFGLLAYLITLGIVIRIKHENQSRVHLSR